VALFVLGILIGALGTHIHTEQKFRKITKLSPEERKIRLMQRYSEKLHLTEAQQEKIQKIVDESTEEISRYFHHFNDLIDGSIHRRDARIKALLTPEQSQLFDKMNQAAEKRRKPKRTPPNYRKER
jgi:Spy/CpxP family protein refolding chaperone